MSSESFLQLFPWYIGAEDAYVDDNVDDNVDDTPFGKFLACIQVYLSLRMIMKGDL